MFIKGIYSISAQIFDKINGCVDYSPIEGLKALAKEPNYTGLIPPLQLRRMGKVIRMGVASALGAIHDAASQTPEKIIIGTAYGCLEDTEIFLRKMIEQEESLLTPTAFIQSTHNTVSGQIALNISCHGHNFTYVHRGHSFEHALMEAMMWAKEHPSIPVLVGGIDELTHSSYEIIGRFGSFKKDDTSTSKGVIPGEGSNMFLVSGEKAQSAYAEVLDVACFVNQNMKENVQAFLEKNSLQAQDIDTIYVGTNGIRNDDHAQLEALSLFQESTWLQFKNYCGEYPTSVAFGLFLACLKNQVHDNSGMILKVGTIHSSYALIMNEYKNKYQSLILLQR